MRSLLHALLILPFALLFSCKQLTNTNDPVALRCGDDVARGTQVVIPLNSYGRQFTDFELRAVAVADTTQVDLRVSKRGCVELNDFAKNSQYIVLSASRQGEFWSSIESMMGNDASREIVLPSFPAADLAINCPKIPATRQTIRFPIGSAANLDGRYFRLKVDVKGDSLMQGLNLGAEGGGEAEFDVSAFREGDFEFNLQLFGLLHEGINVNRSIKCNITVDKTPPDVQIVLGSSGSDSPFLNPGEKIFFKSNEETSFQYCWERIGLSTNDANQTCEFLPWQSDLNAPAGGEWMLKYYGLDAAGNSSPVQKLVRLITTKGEIEATQAMYEIANFQMEQGASLQALNTYIAAEKRRALLPEQKERDYLLGYSRDSLRKAAFTPGPINEIEIENGLKGIQLNPDGNSFLTYSSYGILQIWNAQGQLLRRIHPNEFGNASYAEWNHKGDLLLAKNSQNFVPTKVEIWRPTGELVARLGVEDGLASTDSDFGMDKKVHFIKGSDEVAIPQEKRLILFNYLTKAQRVIDLPGRIGGFNVSPSGKQILVATGTVSKNVLTSYQVSDLSARTIPGDFGRITSIQFSENEEYTAIVSDTLVKVYDASGSERMSKRFNLQTWNARFMALPNNRVGLHLDSFHESLVIDLDGRVLMKFQEGRYHTPLVALNSHTYIGATDTKFYKFGTLSEKVSSLNVQEGLNVIAAQPNSKVVLLGYRGGQVSIWSRDQVEKEYASDLIQPIDLFYSFNAKFTTDSLNIVRKDSEGVGVWTKEGKPVLYHKFEPGETAGFDSEAGFHAASGRLLYLSKSPSGMNVNIVKQGAPVERVEFANAEIALAPDRFEYAVLQNQKVRIYRDGQSMATFDFPDLAPGQQPRLFEYSADGRYLLGSSEASIHVWNSEGQLIDSTDSSGNSAKISSQGNVLVATYVERSYDVFVDGRRVFEFPGGETGSIDTFGFLGDDRSLAIQTNKGVSIHDLKDSNIPPKIIEERLFDGVLSTQAQGDLLALGYYAADRTRVWSERGERVIELQGIGGRPNFSPDNNYLLLGGTRQSYIVQLNEIRIRSQYCGRMKDYIDKTFPKEDVELICPSQDGF